MGFSFGCTGHGCSDAQKPAGNSFISEWVQNRRDAKDPLPLDANLLLGDEVRILLSTLRKLLAKRASMARKLWSSRSSIGRGGLGWAAVLYRARTLAGRPRVGHFRDRESRTFGKKALRTLTLICWGTHAVPSHWVFGDKVHRRAFRNALKPEWRAVDSRFDEIRRYPIAPANCHSDDHGCSQMRVLRLGGCARGRR